MHDTLPIHHDTGEDRPGIDIISQAGPFGTEAWAYCSACGWRGRNHARRADAEAEGAAHRCPVPLDNQGQPVHGDKVPFAAARRDLLRGGAA